MSIHSLERLKGLRNGQVIVRRLRWLEDRLRWAGSVRRLDLMQRFGISPQQASGDIATFQETFPGLLEFDQSAKLYRPTHQSDWVFPKDPVRWLEEEAEHDSDHRVLCIERLAMPLRRGEDDILAALISSFETRTALTIQYQSLSSPEPTARTICGHVLVDTGDRLHVRAWDDRRSKFADFVAARILSATPDHGYPWVDGRADNQWHETVDIILEPARGFSGPQRSMIEREFGMEGGRLAITTRKALATYVLDRLGIAVSREASKAGGTKQMVRCANMEQIREFLP